jgi:hypothetical protein
VTESIPDIEDQLEGRALDIAMRMERCAEMGEWTDVHSLSVELRDAVQEVPVESRRDLVLSLQKSNAEVHSAVSGAKKTIEEQLTTLRTGRSAAKAYKANGNG